MNVIRRSAFVKALGVAPSSNFQQVPTVPIAPGPFPLWQIVICIFRPVSLKPWTTWGYVTLACQRLWLWNVARSWALKFLPWMHLQETYTSQSQCEYQLHEVEWLIWLCIPSSKLFIPETLNLKVSPTDHHHHGIISLNSSLRTPVRPVKSIITRHV